MIAFRVQRNDDAPVTADLSGQQITSVIVNSAVADPRCQDPGEPSPDLKMYVSGIRKVPGRKLTDGGFSYVLWSERRLSVGDTITVSIVDVSEADAPIKEKTSAEVIEDGERAELKRLLRKYGT